MLLMFELRGGTRSVFLRLPKHTDPAILLRCSRTEARKTAPTPSLVKLFKLVLQG
jgi:hypothetical protein